MMDHKEQLNNEDRNGFSWKLFIRNHVITQSPSSGQTDKVCPTSREEFICRVNFIPIMPPAIVSELQQVKRLVITEYSRDPEFLKFCLSTEFPHIEPNDPYLQMNSVTEGDEVRLIEFGNYLRERKKAAIVHLSERSDSLILLPPDTEHQNHLMCIFQKTEENETVESKEDLSTGKFLQGNSDNVSKMFFCYAFLV